VHAPADCAWLFQNAFVSSRWRLLWEGYRRWFDEVDLTDVYGYYRLQVQLMLADRPGRRLVAKWPFHLWALDALLRAFPDARIVQIHRDPAVCAASYMSLQRMAGRRLPPDVVDAVAAATIPELLTRAERARRAHPADHFIDVGYAELCSDPLGAVRRIYDRLGAPLGPDAERRMRRWLADNPQHKHGRHDYDTDRADVAAVRERCADYYRSYERLLAAAPRDREARTP
jgi:hypothetical protein